MRSEPSGLVVVRADGAKSCRSCWTARSSTLVARKLGDTAMIIAGAPSYFERFPVPMTVEDLDQHNRLGFGYVRTVWLATAARRRDRRRANGKPRTGQRRRSPAPTGPSGGGLVRLAAFTVRDDMLLAVPVQCSKSSTRETGKSFMRFISGRTGRCLPASGPFWISWVSMVAFRGDAIQHLFSSCD